MSQWNRVSSGTLERPKLDIQQSWWAMWELGENGKEWTMEQKFEKIAEAGFTGISGFLPVPEEMDVWHRLLDRYKLTFSGLAYPANVEDMMASIKLAKQFGRVQFLNSQVKDSFVIDAAAIRLLDELLKVSEEAKMPNFIETHRGMITQDLIRTAGYADALPDLRFTIDLSHYVVAGEMNDTSEQTEAYFDRILKRTAGMHARISNGEQVQIDIGANGDHPAVKNFTRWWCKGMAYWLEQAQPGDVLPLCCELGPPHYYSITRRTEHGQEIEISDRWQQTLLFKRILEEQWEKAKLIVHS